MGERRRAKTTLPTDASSECKRNDAPAQKVTAKSREPSADVAAAASVAVAAAASVARHADVAACGRCRWAPPALGLLPMLLAALPAVRAECAQPSCSAFPSAFVEILAAAAAPTAAAASAAPTACAAVSAAAVAVLLPSLRLFRV